MRSHVDVFPEGLVDLLVDERRNTNRWEKNARVPTSKIRKRRELGVREQIHPRAPLRWRWRSCTALPSQTARSRLVELLAASGGADRNSNENIGFHVDKDEALPVRSNG